MNLKSWPFAVLVLAIGCSASDGDTLTPWPIAEPEVAAEEPDQPVILRASEDDPFYGSQHELFADLPVIPQHSRCAGLIVSIELPFEHGTDPVVLLPRSMTHTADIFGFETKEIGEASWVWESEVGPIGAATLTGVRDPFGPLPDPRMLTLFSYPYTAESTPAPVYSGFDDLLGVGPGCGSMPLDQSEAMILPPQVFNLEVLINGTTSVIPMRAAVSGTQNRWGYYYRQIM
jgi:hypothetical protein